MSGGDSSRVPIPKDVRKSIHEIKKTHPKYADDFIHTILKDSSFNKTESLKRLNMIHDVTEIARKHSCDDVYTMLKECNMDPNESAQRLLYIDTFHEVKKKQDRRKNINVDTAEDFRRTRGNQLRGANGGQGTVYSSNALDDVGGGRSFNSGRENGTFNRLERLSRPILPVHSEKMSVVHVAKSDANINSIPAMPNGSYISKLALKPTDIGGGRSLSSARENGATKLPEKVSRQALPVHSEKVNCAVHVAKTDGNVNSKPAMSNGSYLSKLASRRSADVSSSTSDPVVSQITKHNCPVGTINCEIVRRSVPSVSNGRSPNGMKSSAKESASAIIPVIAEAPDVSSTRGLESNVVEKDRIPKSLQPPLLSIHNDSHVVISSLDTHPSQIVNEPQKVAASEQMTVSGADSHVVPEAESELKTSAPKLDVMLEKLAISSHQPVIFPDHLQVPDNFRSLFTFGSLDAASDDSSPLSVIESSQQNGEVITEPFSSNQDVFPTAQEGESQDFPLPQLSEQVMPFEDNSSDPPVEHENTELESTSPTAGFQIPIQLSEQVLPYEDKISSDPPVEHDSKLESTPSTAGFQNPVLPPSFGYMPHVIGPHFVQLDVPEIQSGSSVSASVLGPTPTTQAVMAGQGSMALSPPLFPYFRPPYPSYIPYNPYFPHMYLPQNAHLLNHGVFPLQPPTGNVHLQAVAGGKFPASQYKQSNNEDLNVSQPKENNTHSAVQQVDDAQVWGPAGGRDAPILVPNYFYNFPQGQHMAFSPLHAGLYHSSQTITAQSTVGPLVYQSPSTSGNIELVVQPPGSHQQSQYAPQINSNSALPNRETN
uniref:GBF-interacting protein 1-like n=1 Tax=Erigeron canadensis TaxID=72917 RepID=UPI001CB9113E|nr:GBF-interacting protein 1-like [Erigeron canadensis]